MPQYVDMFQTIDSDGVKNNSATAKLIYRITERFILSFSVNKQ